MNGSRPEPSDAWTAALERHLAAEGDSLLLGEIRAGDRLQVRTRHTCYDFTWGGGGAADLVTDREDRPAGAVRIHGCALGAGTTIAPDRIFNGGSLEFTSGDGSLVHRTTPIRSIRWWRRVAG